ncbi:MAG: transposase [Verrucomicrobiota bacterium]|nr:transposase [Verrucomicrobiota bacterium]
MQKTTIRYSEAFKLQVIREVEEGKYSGCTAAAKAYGIMGDSTVHCWAKKYGREHLTRKLIRVETQKDREDYKQLKERIRSLERALSDATLDLRLEREYVKLACEQAGIKDVEQFKKKASGK